DGGPAARRPAQDRRLLPRRPRARDRRCRRRAPPRARGRVHERQHARRAGAGARAGRRDRLMVRLRPALVVHYHEISLKRGNRPLFLRHLRRNVERALADTGPAAIAQLSGRILVDLEGHPAPEGARDRVARIFGVTSVTLAYRAPSTVDALLSGGIDSPVAAWRMMKRGCRVLFVHFHSVPYLPATSQAKARALVERLTAWQYASRLYLVPFGEIQREVVLSVPPPLRVVVYRRLMLRITQELARRGGALALATGESLGQVASQTLENIACIDEAASLPVLRPLIGMDKLEITTAAQEIGTFEISIEPDADCCTLFTPRHPATRATLDEIRAAEVALNLDRLVAAGADGAVLETFAFPGAPAAAVSWSRAHFREI